nr:polysaccharide deacetylase family protein [Nesterenkonia sandarakina]
MFGSGVVVSAISACSRGPSKPAPTPAATKTAPPVPSAAPDQGQTGVASREEIIANYQNVAPGEFGPDIPGIKVALPPGSTVAAITLDACGGPNGSGLDRQILDTLRYFQIPATLFINQRWAQEHPETMGELVDDTLFDIENHGTKHLPLSVDGQAVYGIEGTRSVGEVYDEIMGNQEYLRSEYGVQCQFFRPGTAFLDETSAQICLDLGLTPAGFSLNLDNGATLPAESVEERVTHFAGGDIGLGHFNIPSSGTGTGLARALPQLMERDIEFATLRQATR